MKWGAEAAVGVADGFSDGCSDDQGTTRTGSSGAHSTDHSASMSVYLSCFSGVAKVRRSGVGLEEAQEGVFGPVAVVLGGGVGVGEEGAMAAVTRLGEGDVGVGEDGGAGLRGEADEGIIQGVEDESGDGDAVQDTGGGGAEVVVVRAGEAGVEGGDAVVEVAQGADADGLVGIVGAGKEADLAAKSTEESAKEFELVDAVEGLMEGVGGGAEVSGGRDSDDGLELWRGLAAELAGELEDEVSAHGVADEGDGLQVVEGGEVIQYGEDVVGEAGVIEGGGEVFGSAAVAHVHADGVGSGEPELVGVADDVLGVGGAFEAVKQDGGGPFGADLQGLPVAVAEDLAADLVVGRGGDLDQDGLWRRELVLARKVVAEDGLEVAVLEEAAGAEGREVLGGHYSFPAGCVRSAVRRLAAFSAPVGSSSCLK